MFSRLVFRSSTATSRHILLRFKVINFSKITVVNIFPVFSLYKVDEESVVKNFKTICIKWKLSIFIANVYIFSHENLFMI